MLVPAKTPLGFFCQNFSFAKFTFGLEPKLYIPSYRPDDFFPDFPGLSQSAGSLFQLLRQSQDAMHGFSVAHPSREVAVLVGLLYEAGDGMLLIHSALHLELDDGAAKIFTASLSQP